MKKSGFTIVEMLVVIAVIAILAGAITMGVGGMFYKSRLGKAKAMRGILQSGLETYYARMGEWPDAIKSKADYTGGDSVELSPSEVDSCFREIVKVSVGSSANPVLDPSSLYVMRNANQYCCTDIHRSWNAARDHGVVSKSYEKCKCDGKCAYGRDFSEATKKGAKNRIRVADMSFGYPGPNHGRFCRFRIFYDVKADTVRVHAQPATEHGCSKHNNGYTDD
jgi:prepilin-type N-terminal cleavage/methylation domain-containing protein